MDIDPRMMKNEIVMVKNCISSNDCITISDGAKVHEVLWKNICVLGIPVELDFAGIGAITSVFLNRSIGLFSEKQISDYITFKNLMPYEHQIFRLVIKNSEKYRTNASYRSAVDYVIAKTSRGEYD